MKDYKQPRQLFLDTVVEFYEKLGFKDFWLGGEKQRTIALEALAQDYIRTNHAGFMEEDRVTLQAAIEEYHRRAEYMTMEVSNERSSRVS